MPRRKNYQKFAPYLQHIQVHKQVYQINTKFVNFPKVTSYYVQSWIFVYCLVGFFIGLFYRWNLYINCFWAHKMCFVSFENKSNTWNRIYTNISVFLECWKAAFFQTLDAKLYWSDCHIMGYGKKFKVNCKIYWNRNTMRLKGPLINTVVGGCDFLQWMSKPFDRSSN